MNGADRRQGDSCDSTRVRTQPQPRTEIGFPRVRVAYCHPTQIACDDTVAYNCAYPLPEVLPICFLLADGNSLHDLPGDELGWCV